MRTQLQSPWKARSRGAALYKLAGLPANNSQWEALLLFQIVAAKLPTPEREYRFHPERKFRLDLAWPPEKLGLEVDGGLFTEGRHTRGYGIERDCEKLSMAVAMGWRILRVAPIHVKKGLALLWVEQALAACAQS